MMEIYRHVYEQRVIGGNQISYILISYTLSNLYSC